MTDLIKQIDGLIQIGLLGEARRQLHLLKKAKINRLHACAIAALARRAQLETFSLQLLSPYVRPAPRSVVRATPEERIEYAAALSAVGASDEALEILNALDSGLHPRVLFFKAFTLITRWDYRSCIPLFEKFLASPLPTGYERLIAKVNLAQGLVCERSPLAGGLLAELVTETSQSGFNLLYGTCLAYSAQHAIEQKSWEKAQAFLSEAHKKFDDKGGIYVFLLRKWEAILEALRDGKTSSVEKIRLEAIERSHWETVRQTELILAIVGRDEQGFQRVYFGTPYDSFRRNMIFDFPTAVALPQTYWWKIEKGPDAFKLDLVDLQNGLKSGSLSHRLLSALSTDFYRRYTVAQLHYRLYPGEFFNLKSSPLRVHKALNRLRSALTSLKIPLLIEEVQGTYKLKATAACEIRVSSGAVESSFEFQLRQLSDSFKGTPFSASQVSGELRLSRMSALRLLAYGRETGLLVTEGRGPRTRYVFAPLKKAA